MPATHPEGPFKTADYAFYVHLLWPLVDRRCTVDGRSNILTEFYLLDSEVFYLFFFLFGKEQSNDRKYTGFKHSQTLLVNCAVESGTGRIFCQLLRAIRRNGSVRAISSRNQEVSFNRLFIARPI